MRRLLPDLAGITGRIAQHALCTLFGHDWTDRADPPACRDCGRTRKAPR